MFPFCSVAFISLWHILTVNFPLTSGHLNCYDNRTCLCISKHVMFFNDMLLLRQSSILRLSLFVFSFFVCISAVFASACPLAPASVRDNNRVVTDCRSVSFGFVVYSPYCASSRNTSLFGVEPKCTARRPGRSPALVAVVLSATKLIYSVPIQ